MLDDTIRWYKDNEDWWYKDKENIEQKYANERVTFNLIYIY